MTLRMMMDRVSEDIPPTDARTLTISPIRGDAVNRPSAEVTDELVVVVDRAPMMVIVTGVPTAAPDAMPRRATGPAPRRAKGASKETAVTAAGMASPRQAPACTSPP